MTVTALSLAPFLRHIRIVPNRNSGAAKSFGWASCAAGIFYSAQGILDAAI
jgi:hypothetical protein